jgi:3-isopropylmalate/(R)-2-methylmalate dehydratase small subunit
MTTKDQPTWHKVWHVGDDVDTDALAPGAYMQHGIDVIAQHCLENVLPNFARDVKPGDIIVAGPNFGIGSSREQAAAALKHLGVAAVIAPSYGGLFFRNAFNLGLLLITSPDTGTLQNQELLAHISIDLEANFYPEKQIKTTPIPDFLLDMVRAGGLLNSLKQRKRDGAFSHA